MKPPRFEYFDPARLEDALALLSDLGDDAKVLAGGQSLVPLLNFRLARPRYLIDLNRIPDLGYVTPLDGGLAVGAMTRQREVERSPLVRARCPLLAEAVPYIGHVQIRNRGTIGGSLAHADPAAELPAVVSVLGARLVVRRVGEERVLDPDRFFTGYLTTGISPDELLVEVRIPPPPPRAGSAFLEVSRRHGDFALVGVAARLALDPDGICTGAAMAFTGVGPAPVRVEAAERLLVGAKPTHEAFRDAGRRVAQALDPESDLHASAAYRREVAGVLTERVLARALANVREEA